MTNAGRAVERWHALIAAVQGGDLDAAEQLVAPGFHWQAMGRSPQAGRYDGVQGLSQLMTQVRDASDGTFHLATEMSVGDDNNAVMIGRVSATRARRTLDIRNVFVLQCEDGLIARGWTIPMDQYTFDEFWA